MPERANAPSPQLFFDTASGYQRTAVLRAALEFDLFTAIGEGRAAADELAKRCGTSVKGMRVLCDYLTVLGFLTKQAGRYALTPDTATFLNRRSPAYLGGTLEFLHTETLRNAYNDLVGVVRKGGTVQSHGGLTDQEHPDWVRFARAMAPMMAIQTQLVPGLIGRPADARLKVLDIAAGHGMFGIQVAKRFPNAEIVALDWPKVLQVAVQNAQQAGLSERYRTIAGNAFDVGLGGHYDVVLLPNFLHHFGAEACVGFLRRVCDALQPDGMAITVEFVPDEDRVSPPFPANFAMAMLVLTPDGDAYTFPELQAMLTRAGFSRSTLHRLEPSMQSAIVSHR